MKRAWQRLRRPVGWALRTRLVATMIALLALVSLVIGAVSVLVVNSALLSGLDAKLVGQPSQPRGGGGDPADDNDRRGPPPGGEVGGLEATLGDCVVSSVYVTVIYVDHFDGRPLTSTECAALTGLPHDGRPRTVDIQGLGKYRVVATPDGDFPSRVVGLPLSQVTNTVYRLAAVMTVVSLLGLLLVGMIGTATVRLALRPLRRVAATASRVAELPLDRGEVALGVRVPEQDTDARTEVGQVGAALNRMLGHIANALTARQASEARVRKFVADASHELRTPLASIRGYAELTRRDRAAIPPQVAHALTRVESEAVRMTGLVEDLLLLARLDAGRPVERRPVDLTALVVDAVSDAHAAGPDHRWDLDLPDDPVVIAGDRGRLHQVVANLLANARTHTPNGTQVTIRLASTSGDVLLQVVDDGPGIPPDLLPEVFERFTRADSSRSRATGSTGLGLAIVAAVVEAHRGTVEVESTPGRTVFSIHIPRDPAPIPAPTPVTTG
jgi:two-component system, OmpR family, sensor kinase